MASDLVTRNLLLAANLISKFRGISSQNTLNNIETGGLLFGELQHNTYVVDKLVIPKQVGRDDYWNTTDETEIATFQLYNPSLILLRTIHTHPRWNSIPSSVDLHQQFDIQKDNKSAIGIILGAEEIDCPIISILQEGMEVLGACGQRGFHPHNRRILNESARHVDILEELDTTVVDQR